MASKIIPALLLLIIAAYSNCEAPVKTIVEPTSAYDPTIDYALPKHLYPESYKIVLSPVFNEVTDKTKHFKFSGVVDILINVKTKTKDIVLNARNLTGLACSVTPEKGEKLESTLKDIDVAKTEKITISVKEDLKVGTKYSIHCTYNGDLNHTDWKGFYLSDYEEDGKTQYLGTTQFESSGARRAFPCFDEPGFKATFQVTINSHKDYKTVISNTEGESKISGDTMVTTFKTTPVMSTYLLAFIVAKFERYEGKYENTEGKTVRMDVYSQKNLKNFAEQSQAFGVAAIKSLEDFLGLKYSAQLNKLDQIGIPDFAAGAMENWGLVTYREPQFFFNPDESTSSNLRSIYCTITHEFAHQWFGNLVTPAWWNYIWLNEGFATYFEFIGTEKALTYLPEKYKEKTWRTAELFAVSKRHEAFANDGDNNTRPMSYPAETPEEVNDLFDRIAYSKAGSVLFMMEHILSTNVWKKGLNKYLSARPNGIVEPKHLWDAFQEAYDEAFANDPMSVTHLGHLSVNDIGNSWSLETGFPVVTVTKEGTKVTLKQSRFQTDFRNDAPTKWMIPINYALESSLQTDLQKTLPVTFLKTGKRNLVVAKEKDFILLNNQQTGYYRVNYDEKNWDSIITFLNKSDNAAKLLPVTQAQLVDDALNLGRGGYLSYPKVLALVRFLTGVTDFIPWQAAVNNLKFLDVQLRGSSIEKHYKQFNKDILTKVYDAIVNDYEVKPEDAQSLKLNRLNIFKRACDVGLESCLTKAAAKLKPYVDDPTKKLRPDLQVALYCGGVRTGKSELFDGLVKRFEKLTNAVEKKNLVTGLGCFEDKKVLEKVLDAAIDSKSKISEHATSAYLGMIEAGTIGVEVVLDHIGKHHEHIVMAIGKSNMTSIITTLGNNIASKSHLDKLTKLNKVDVSVDSVTEKVNKKMEWNKVYMKDIEEWLKANVKGAASGLLINTGLLISAILLTFWRQ